MAKNGYEKNRVKESVNMGNVYKIISGGGLLIFVYLVLNNFKATTSIISSLGSNASTAVKVFQGR